VVKRGHFRKQKYQEVLKCGAGEGLIV